MTGRRIPAIVCAFMWMGCSSEERRTPDYVGGADPTFGGGPGSTDGSTDVAADSHATDVGMDVLSEVVSVRGFVRNVPSFTADPSRGTAARSGLSISTTGDDGTLRAQLVGTGGGFFLERVRRGDPVTWFTVSEGTIPRAIVGIPLAGGKDIRDLSIPVYPPELPLSTTVSLGLTSPSGSAAVIARIVDAKGVPRLGVTAARQPSASGPYYDDADALREASGTGKVGTVGFFGLNPSAGLGFELDVGLGKVRQILTPRVAPDVVTFVLFVMP